MLARALFAAAAPSGAGGRLSILIFHRVLACPDPLFPGEVDAHRFDGICRWLRRWFNVLPLDLAVDALQRGTLPTRPLAITFDDGYRDNHDVALPILERHGLTATFFVTVGFLDGGRMWNDTVIESIRGAPVGTLDLSDLGLGMHPLSDSTSRRLAIDSVLPRVKYLDSASRRAAVDTLCERAVGGCLPDDLMMSSAQVRALGRAGMGIGAHTVTHPILTGLSDAELCHEVSEGRKILEHIVARPVHLFAYPNGKPGVDYDSRAVDAVRRAGYAAALSTAWGAAKQGDDLFQLPRFTPWDRSSIAFAMRMLGNFSRSPETVALSA